MSEDLLEKGWYVNEKKVGKGSQYIHRYTDGVIELMYIAYYIRAI